MILHLDKKYYINDLNLKGIKKRKKFEIEFVSEICEDPFEGHDQLLISVMDTDDHKTDKTNYYVLLDKINVTKNYNIPNSWDASLKKTIVELECRKVFASNDWDKITKNIRKDRLKSILSI